MWSLRLEFRGSHGWQSGEAGFEWRFFFSKKILVKKLTEAFTRFTHLIGKFEWRATAITQEIRSEKLISGCAPTKFHFLSIITLSDSHRESRWSRRFESRQNASNTLSNRHGLLEFWVELNVRKFFIVISARLIFLVVNEELQLTLLGQSKAFCFL